MKRNIAIVAGGDTSEIVVSLRSAQGIYSFIDKEKYNLYIVEMEGRRWEVQLPDGNKVPVDRNDFSFTNGTEKVVFDFAYIASPLLDKPGHVIRKFGSKVHLLTCDGMHKPQRHSMQSLSGTSVKAIIYKLFVFTKMSSFQYLMPAIAFVIE